jgi:hydroxymethylpyrimidine/phosphomethylpyrimidine kinase
LPSRRQHTRNTHGTGCTLSSAVTAYLARGLTLRKSVELAQAYVEGAIAAAHELNVGSGHGPVHHCHALYPRAG